MDLREPRRSSRLMDTVQAALPQASPKPPKSVKKARSSRTAKITSTTAQPLLNLYDMPLDILCEVSEYLVPNHLLQLARTCSTLRAIFMSRSSEIIWRTARKRFYAMPDPPAGMSEPMYIHLAFGDACDSCGGPNVNQYWYDRVIVCYNCHAKLFQNTSTLREKYSSLPTEFWASLSDWGSTKYSAKTVTSWNDTFRSLQTKTECDAWLEVTQLKVAESNAVDKSFFTWMNAMRREKYLENQRQREEWKTSVYQNLSKLGWDDEVGKLYTKYELEGLMFDVDNNQTWADIEPRLTDYLKKTKSERLKREKHTILVSRLRIFHDVYESYRRGPDCSTGSDPDHVEIAAMIPAVRAIIREDLLDPHRVTRELIENAITPKDVHEAVAQWTRETQSRVLQLLREALKNPNMTTIDLNLAAATFLCKKCSEILYYPSVASHHHAFDISLSKRYLRLVKNADSQQGGTSWNSTRSIAFNRLHYLALVELLKLLDPKMNPTAVTRHELDKKDIMIHCMDCRQTRRTAEDKKRVTFGWRGAICHARQMHDSVMLKHVTWKIPSPEGQVLLRAEREAAGGEQQTVNHYLMTERD